MSNEALNWVIANSKQKGSARLLLFVIANLADDHGEAWPGLDYLAKATGLERRYVIDLQKKLEESGEMTVTHRKDGNRNKSNLYRVVMPGSPGVVNPASLGSEPGITMVVNPASLGVVMPGSPNTLIDTSINPNNTLQEKPRKRGKREPKQEDLPKAENPIYPIACALATVTSMDLSKNPAIFRDAKKYYKPEDVPRILSEYGKGGIWYLCDWRGKQGQFPTLAQIRETWGRLKPNGSSTSPEPSDYTARAAARKEAARQQYGVIKQ